jgi:4,5-dihydroxyphthalate decarboxylase
LTPGVWVRGILQHAYGVDLEQVTWILVGDEHVAEYVAPANVVSAPEGSELGAMLQAGDIDAAIGLNQADSPHVQPLIPAPEHAAVDFYRQTGIYPISHIVVVKDAVLSAHPWLAEALCDLFKTAKAHYLRQLNTGGSEDVQDKRMNALRQVVGDDPLPYGLEANRATLETFIQYNVEQKVIPAPMSLDDLFPSRVLGFA